MRLSTRLAAVAALCLLASPALAQAPVALQNTNNLSDCSVLATCRANIGAAASGANSDITSLTGLTTPLPLSEGGLGATTPAGDRTAIGAAASGANSDITSLSAVTSMTLQTLQVTASRLGPGGNLLESGVAPVVASGFGTSPTVTANGTESFAITVGTGGDGHQRRADHAGRRQRLELPVRGPHHAYRPGRDDQADRREQDDRDAGQFHRRPGARGALGSGRRDRRAVRRLLR